MKTKSLLMLAVLAILATVGFTSCDELALEDNPMQSYITMRTSDVTLKVGETYVRKAVAAGTAVVIYSSSDATVATVDQTGTVTAVAAGTAVITAQTTGYNAEGKKIYLAEEKSYVVTVKPATLPAATITTVPTATPGSIAACSTTALVTAGVADGGTMMYEVTTTNTKPATTDGFSATVPTAAKLAAGPCYVWYYAKADAQHSDSEIAATAIEVTVKASYLKWDNTQKELVATPMPDTYTTVTSSTTTWSAGTYVVEGDVIINASITLNGAVDLIIKDGAKLTVNNYIYGNTSKYNLSIYGQANQSGQLVVNCSDNDAIWYITTLEVHSCKVTATSSSVGCGGFYDIKTFNVYGGSIDAECTNTGFGGYGIRLAAAGSMNIYGGDVKAVGKGNIATLCYGIYANSSSTVKVYGGKLWAECAGNKAIDFVRITLNKDDSFTGKIEYSSDKSTWSETVDASAKYVRAGY